MASTNFFLKKRTKTLILQSIALAEDMYKAAGIEAEYCHKKTGFIVGKGFDFQQSARQDLEGFSKFTEFGVEAIVHLDLLPPEYQAKPSDRCKRAKKEETISSVNQSKENQNVSSASEVNVKEVEWILKPQQLNWKLTLQLEISLKAEHIEEADAEVEPEVGNGETDSDFDIVARV